MCLYSTPEAIAKFRKNKRGRTAICYKVLEVVPGSGLFGPYRDLQYHAGWNKSNSKRRFAARYDTVIRNGIHVCITEHGAANMIDGLSWRTGFYKIVKVICYMDDLLGVEDVNEAVFKKVYLSKREYEKAMS